MIGPPTSKPGIVRGTEPEARITLVPVIVADVPSFIDTVTVRSAPREPTPLKTSTLRPLHIAAMPPTRPATIFCLRCCVTAKFDGRLARLDTEVGAVVDVAFDGRCLQERLGGDASSVEAGAAERVLLDQGDLHSGGRGVEGGGVATGAPTDDDEVERVTHDGHRIVATRR